MIYRQKKSGTVTDGSGMGERKKVEESFCLRLERREEKEEDTMLC